MTRCGLDGKWWTDVGPNWEYGCNLNPGQLARVVTGALNTQSLALCDMAYNAPLSTPFIDLIIDYR